MINCPSCEKFDGHDCELFGRQPSMAICPYAVERKPRNRFEKLKSMSMEELASLFCKFLSCYYCPGFNVLCENRCKEYWLDWLKEEIADA